MGNMSKYLIGKDAGLLQISYEEYVALMEQAKKAEEVCRVAETILSSFKELVGEETANQVLEESAREVRPVEPVAEPMQEELPAEQEPVAEQEPMVEEEPIVEQEPVIEKSPVAPIKKVESVVKKDSPPIKKDICEHFNQQDTSGRLFNVFKQYYTCLNDSCAGPVRVTMKDGFCSLWNYDEWAEFAFIDVHEGQLRIAIDPRHTDAIKSLNLCGVPQLLSSRYVLVCVQIDDLNNTMLNVLVKAFDEVGFTAK